MSWYPRCLRIRYLERKFEEFFDESSEEVSNQNEIVLVKFNKDIEFLVSEDGENFSFIPSKTIEQIKFIWFDEDKGKHILFKRLSKLSENRKVFHEPEYFVNRIKKVYFRYENKQIVPYRYTVNKEQK